MKDNIDEEVIAQYQTARVRTLWKSYKRIFQLRKYSIVTIDPANFAATHNFLYDEIIKIYPNDKHPNQFTVEVNKQGSFAFETAYRSQLLCQLHECCDKATHKFLSNGPYTVERIKKNGTKNDVTLTSTPYGLIECDKYGRTIQEYKYVNITKVGVDTGNLSIFFEACARIKVYQMQMEPMKFVAFVDSIRKQLDQLGLGWIPFLLDQKYTLVVEKRLATSFLTNSAPVAVFDVYKPTRRYNRLMPRQLHVTEEFIVEKECVGYAIVSAQRLERIYSLVRCWESPKEFTIEFDDGSSRTYYSAIRDTLLAILLDVAHATGNVRVIVTGEESDALRLMPRFAEEKYKSSISDAFFGSDSIESWYLNRLAKSCRKITSNSVTVVDIQEIVTTSRELNANIPCPGIAVTSDTSTVKTVLAGVLRALQYFIVLSVQSEKQLNARAMAVLLQTLFRVVSSLAGFKCFVEVRDVDPRLILVQLLHINCDFVNYWTLEVLITLCHWQHNQITNIQQEFVNKHTLLTDAMLVSLVNLMSTRVEFEATDTASESSGMEVTANAASTSTSTAPSGTDVPGTDAGVSVRKSASTGEISSGYGPGEAREDSGLFPNSLVIVGSAALLESILSSNRDTSSPELMNKVLDQLSDRCEVLVHMLRSTSFLIMENASILMHILLKNRNAVSPILQEAALSECLALKHFYGAMFSPSASQRFISRFLVSNWLSGPEDCEGKRLLRRMIPSGLVEYLQYSPIDEPQRESLDEIEEEFYKTYGSARAQSSRTLGRVHSRMKNRISVAQGSRKVDMNSLQMLVTGNGQQDGWRHSFLLRKVGHVRRDSAARESDAGEAGGSAPDSSVVEKDGKKPDTEATIGDEKPAVNAAGSTRSGSPAGEVGGLSSVMPPLPPAVPAGIPPKISSSSQSQSQPQPEPQSASPKRVSSVKQTKVASENFRIMFHAMTQDHQLPDLIWNEHTRMELRSTLEAELLSFEREQRLRGAHKVAWNYLHFSVRYESLSDELRVGPIYLRYYLDAGDTFLRSLTNPPHTVLFEKLMRRVLVYVERNPRLATLCTRCLIRLYSVSGDSIGTFDDVMLIVRLLEQAGDVELQHCLLDLLESLSVHDSNLLQLLEKDFISMMLRYSALGHLNPDQIGNVLARATLNVRLLTDGQDPSSPSQQEPVEESGVDAEDADENREQRTELSGKHVSMWAPDDAACPRTWFVADPTATLPPPLTAQRGPFRVTELVGMAKRGNLSERSLVAPITSAEIDGKSEIECRNSLVDTGRWKALRDHFQLRIQLLNEGSPVYTPAEVACKCLLILSRLAGVHKSTNSKGVLFHPLPTSKRLMSDQQHLVVFAQLLLCNDYRVVEVAANILRGLVQHNTHACSKLYLTGAFFFICRYTGNNFLPLAQLLSITHLRQSFHDSAASMARDLPVGERSVLSAIVPPALINILDKYGPEKFTSVFTSSEDSPELIWNANIREHTVEMINQHIGDFAARLRQNSSDQYEYCPIPKVHYTALDKELYCHNFYLRNLCDEIRFPKWPIDEPLFLIRDVIEKWRMEMEKHVEDQSVIDAKALLNLSEHFTNEELRRAYKAMARLYHPDKNASGREMFEKIHIAYELLSSEEMEVNKTDLHNVVLLLNAQIIVYARAGVAIQDQKYPAYPLLTEVLTVPDSQSFVEQGVNRTDQFKTSMDILNAGCRLIYLTMAVAPLNCEEFIKSNAIGKLFEIFVFALKVAEFPHYLADVRDILVYTSQAFSVITMFESGRKALLPFCADFVLSLYESLALDRTVPLAVESCVAVISNCAIEPDLQRSFVKAGVLWRLLPMLLAYDTTIGDVSVYVHVGHLHESEDAMLQRSHYNQRACNIHAILSARALGRLAGVMFEDLATASYPEARSALRVLLTPPISKLLRNRRPEELLLALNENTEKPTKIWNVGMRSEVLSFIAEIDRSRSVGLHDDEMDCCKDFQFTCLRDELCLDDVYLRVFTRVGDATDIDDPSRLCNAVLSYIRKFLLQFPTFGLALDGMRESSGGGETDEPDVLVSVANQELAVETLRVLAEGTKYIGSDIARNPFGVEVVIGLLTMAHTTQLFASACQLLFDLSSCADFVHEFSSRQSCVTVLLRALCGSVAPPTTLALLWSATEALAASSEGLLALLNGCAVPLLLAVVFNVTGFNSVYKNRLSAVALLSKLMWNPVCGAQAYGQLRRFLPEPVVTLLRDKAASLLSTVLDVNSETPELIWTAEMLGEVRAAMIRLLCLPNGQKGVFGDGVDWRPALTADFCVTYRQLAAELYVGAVYIRLYLRQPTFKLTHPVMFAETLISRWEEAFELQTTLSSSPLCDNADKCYDLVLGKEDFLSLMTSCLVCLIKGEPALVDHILSWGFANKATDLLCKALDNNCRGAPVTSVIRLLHQMADSIAVADALTAASSDIVLQLTRTLDISGIMKGQATVGIEPSLPKEASFIVELVKKIFLDASEDCLLELCKSACRCSLPIFLIDYVISQQDNSVALREVRSPSSLRVHTVELLQTMASRNNAIHELLEQRPIWRAYSSQSHDLFISNKERTDPFLLEDSSDKRFVGLLTNGVSSEVSPLLSSNTTATISRGSSEARPPQIRPDVKDSEADKELVAPSTVADPAAVTAPILPDLPSTSSSSGAELVVKVVKGEHGVGLDLCKGGDGRALVQRLKPMPPGVNNPSLVCSPAIMVGDVITAVNGTKCDNFSDAVRLIRGSDSSVTFSIRRTF